jgi:glycosyltransferase involved in cell wall biosynthesis
MRLDAVYVAYWSLEDPLCLSQSLPVVRALASRGLRMGLVTFEQPPWRMPPAGRRRAQRALLAEGVRWLPLRYHRHPRLIATLFDAAHGLARCVLLGWLRGVGLFHGRGSVPSAIAWIAARLTGARFFDDADGPLSEEYVDAGVWKRGSLSHRLTRWAESRCLAAADAVAVLTERRRLEVLDQARAEVTVLPCAVDAAHFTPRLDDELRRDLNLQGTVLVYVGKRGGWYLTEAMFDFARAAADTLGSASLLVVTPETPEGFEALAAERGLRCVVRRATRDEMPRYLAAADAGLSLILQTPSKLACSPVKNGEYLACGLPVITTPGVGDYTELVEKHRVGVVIRRLDPDGYREAAIGLRALLADTGLAARCRLVAEREVGLSQVVLPRYFEIYRRLLGRPLPDGRSPVPSATTLQ